MKKSVLAIAILFSAFSSNANDTVVPKASDPLNITTFQGYLTNNKVNLSWTVTDNQNVDQFLVERSVDGKEFSTAALVFNTEKLAEEAYAYYEAIPASKSFYRVKMMDKSGTLTYSKVILFESAPPAATNFKLIDNPIQDKLNFRYEAVANSKLEIKIMDLAGRPVFQQTLIARAGTNMLSLSVPNTMSKGMYIMNIQEGVTQTNAKFIKN